MCLLGVHVNLCTEYEVSMSNPVARRDVQDANDNDTNDDDTG